MSSISKVVNLVHEFCHEEFGGRVPPRNVIRGFVERSRALRADARGHHEELSRDREAAEVFLQHRVALESWLPLRQARPRAGSFHGPSGTREANRSPSPAADVIVLRRTSSPSPLAVRELSLFGRTVRE